MSTRTIDLKGFSAAPGNPIALEAQLVRALDMIKNGISSGAQIRLVIKTVPKSSKNDIFQQLRFPGDTPNECWKFAVHVRILGILAENLRNGKHCTRRDVYYQDVALFKNQRTVNEAIGSISHTLGVTEDDLHASAGQKGLLYGNLKLSAGTKMMVFDQSMGPALIPLLAKNLDLTVEMGPGVEYIAVVEKEAVFRYLCDGTKNAILITGKGFPDRLTQTLVQKIGLQLPNTPLWALVDADVYGLMIYRKYRERCPRIRFKGLQILSAPLSSCMDISSRDFQMLTKLLETSDVDLKREVHRQIWLFRKAELSLDKEG